MLISAQIRPSHAKNCFENGLSERTNGIVKNEYLIDYDIKSLNQLNAVLTKIKHQINEVWPSGVLGYRTPEQFAQWTRELKTSERPLKLIKTV
jgi:IS30 family transposase